ncbi:MAG: D-2-hydroxyacid dehydrogenase [Gemmatimonadetes bacterium]|nr:D-2-hydroxyacid dehydrogenase [Gemmatimonadota bacterium]
MTATIVIDLRDRRPIWELPDRAREAITAALPPVWTVRFMETLSDGSGDGAGHATGELLEAVADARVYMGYGIPAAVLDHGRRLEWVHSGAAGVAGSLHPTMLASDVHFTNSAGIHAAPMAETVMAMILHFARGLDVAVRAQHEGRWSAPEYWAADAPVTEVGASTVGIIGFGGIGREVARRAAAMGARVIGVRRGGGDILTCIIDDEKYKLEYQIGSGRHVLDNTIGQSDFLVLTLPETAETRGIMTRERLFAMKPGAVLINVARGRLVDEDALLEALDSGRLRGAGLDVFHTEPLPADHPFYRHPRVLMTPHVSATTRRFWDRQTELITDNIGRFARGEPLRNLVDKTAGY